VYLSLKHTTVTSALAQHCSLVQRHSFSSTSSPRCAFGSSRSTASAAAFITATRSIRAVRTARGTMARQRRPFSLALLAHATHLDEQLTPTTNLRVTDGKVARMTQGIRADIPRLGLAVDEDCEPKAGLTSQVSTSMPSDWNIIRRKPVQRMVGKTGISFTHGVSNR
jgi:hypothetical protein